ncbi:hemerythrin domain-containing protein [Stutzerimonas stutzeri]|uniref:hemerythrin domain-containing protein n=1 Tax=Stutzerimonas stutzeri TaxID=316 RepID=UPI002659289D|nr:hemerythrin domain-containing protein [Stutzerimonas stutzeri]MCF6782433.1 hemerythrin domain-containing protein [Stutzerimonas stutzeri]MCF6805538.1 hemerythrin domain-containing protein [Stutzerimonas stutzeri]
MTIFEALRQSHEIQRDLADKLLQTSGDSAERRDIFEQFKTELLAHETAEERHFYVPLMQDDLGVDLSRHAIAEHHEMDEMVEELESMEFSSSAWLRLAKKLCETVEHHLEEEEHKFFQMAGKLLDDNQKEQLARTYLEEYAELKERV